MDLIPTPVVERHRQVLEAVGLPVRAPDVSWKDVQTFMKTDKKYAGGVRMVLLEGIGAPTVGKVSAEVMRRAWDAIA
jgi:3-dehydroquinate synthase